jgi:hypothetical protein
MFIAPGFLMYPASSAIQQPERHREHRGCFSATKMHKKHSKPDYEFVIFVLLCGFNRLCTEKRRSSTFWGKAGLRLAGQQLAFNYYKLSVNHSKKIRLTTTSEGKVLRPVRE